MNFIQNLVRAINTINSNVWAFIVLLVGVFLVIHRIDSGRELITGGFALLRSGGSASIETTDTSAKVAS